MSGIYIPNMELPRACFWRDKNGCIRTCFLASICSESPYAQGNYNIKPNSCPLKEVPSHGVLKDIDVLNDAIIEAVRLGEITGGEAGFFKAILNNAPIVIDASKH